MVDVVGYEGLYKVTRTGCVYSVKKQTYIKTYTVRDGVIRVTLRKDKVDKARAVHRLVAEAYIPNPEQKAQVDHIDGNKQNNCVENLRWCTDEENQAFREAQGNTGSSGIASAIKWGDQVYDSIRALAVVIAQLRGSSAKTVRKELRAVRYGAKTLYGKWCELVGAHHP